MDDLEDELASVAGTSREPEPEHAPEPAAPAPAPARHHSPHSGDGTEPDGGTEPA
jgi:segregation and condensation protein B